MNPPRSANPAATPFGLAHKPAGTKLSIPRCRSSSMQVSKPLPGPFPALNPYPIQKSSTPSTGTNPTSTPPGANTRANCATPERSPSKTPIAPSEPQPPGSINSLSPHANGYATINWGPTVCSTASLAAVSSTASAKTTGTAWTTNWAHSHHPPGTGIYPRKAASKPATTTSSAAQAGRASAESAARSAPSRSSNPRLVHPAAPRC